jgi:hypothetical protein
MEWKTGTTRFYDLDPDPELIQLKSHTLAPTFKRPFLRANLGRNVRGDPTYRARDLVRQ